MPAQTPSRPSPLRGLLVLNAALLGVLGAVTFGPGAIAQQRIPGEYTMAAGGAIGLNASVVYILDVRNQELVAITYDYNTKKLDGVGYRNVASDLNNVLRRRPGN